MNFDMTGVSVFLAMPTHRDIPAQTVISLIDTQKALRDKGIPFDVHLEVGGSLVHHSRTSLVHQFIKSTCTHLFWVDSDIVWKSDDFLKLLALATKMDVVCATYPTKTEPPVFYVRAKNINEPIETNQYGCLSIRGSGLGFTVIQRKVIERLYNAAPKVTFGVSKERVPYVFRCDLEGTEARGEDMAFFSDIRDMGYDINLDPTISLGHMGTRMFTGSVGNFIEVEEQAA